MVDKEKPLRALIFDSHYDSYKGVIAYTRVFDGVVNASDRILMMANGVKVTPVEVGILRRDWCQRASWKPVMWVILPQG